MTQTKKKTLTVLGITLILLLTFIISITFAGQNAKTASADSTSAPNETQAMLDSLMANGEVHGQISEEGTPISTVAELRNFLQSGTGKGYLTTDIKDFYWDNYQLTSTLSSVNMTELNGNGHKIYLTATGIASSPAKHIDTDIPNGDKGGINWRTFMTTYFAGEDTFYTNYIDLHGGLIGFLRNYQTIRNCNFVYSGNIDASYTSGNSGTLGLIAALSLGTIDNCSVTVDGKIKIYKDTTYKGSVGDTGTESMARFCFALGGFAGTMTTTDAKVTNSKIILNKDLEVNVRCKLDGGIGYTAYRDPFARAWTGGIVGWMANSAQVFNIVTEGSGNLDARGINDEKGNSRSFSGIIAGISGGDGAGGQYSLAGDITTYGTINGVINNWTGYAKFLTYDTQYSPTNVTENSIQYLIIGVAGLKSNTIRNVTNIFMNKEVYSGTTYSIAFDYTQPKGANGVNQGRQYSTNILMQDVLGQNDGSETFTKANDENAYLVFAGTDISAPIWAVYDIYDEDVILWSKTVENKSTTQKDLVYYYDQATSIKDAKDKFGITHTVINRNDNQNRVIQYLHGKAVYFTKTYNNAQDTSNANRVILNPTQYGNGLTAPTLNLFYDAEHNRPASTSKLMDRSYWTSRGENNNKLVGMDELEPSPDTYESFLYLKDKDGRNHSYIQFLNSTYRYVSYIYDDPVFNAYKQTHPDYEPVNANGEKLIDWQQRVIQTVNPKSVTVEFNHADDIKQTEGIELDPVTNDIISYGKYTTPYDGNPVVFGIDFPNGAIINNETCSANYEYRVWDSFSQSYVKTDSCVNAGKYKVVVTSLSNKNYELAGAGRVEYCIDFVIEQLEIGFIDNMGAELIEDGDEKYYYIKVPYAAKNLTLADEVKIFSKKEQAIDSDAKLAFYNVLAKDESLLKFSYIAHGGGELDMLNVGQFEMILSLVSGDISGNYVLPDVTKFVVEIEPADAKLSDQTYFEYAYGNLIKDKVKPFVTFKGVDGIPMASTKSTYYKKINGVYEVIKEEPFDAGEYQIRYEILNSIFSNYKDAFILVDVKIKQREVGLTFNVNDENRVMNLEYGVDIEETDFGVVFQKHSGDKGVFKYEYLYCYPKFEFYKLDDNGDRIGFWVDSPKDAGAYEVDVQIKFNEVSVGDWTTNENTEKNYNVVHDPYRIVIKQREVFITLNDVTRNYGDEMKEFIGNANVNDEKVRAWRYTDLNDDDKNKVNRFLERDNIVITPYLSDSDRFAAISQTYKVLYREEDMTGDVDEHGYNKISNYIVHVTEGNYTVNKRTVKVKVFLNTYSVVYGEDLPEFLEAIVVGENGFFESDNIKLVESREGVEKGSSVGTYYISTKVELPNYRYSNYYLDIEEAEFKITPKSLTLTGVDVEGETTVEVKFNGANYDATLNDKIKAHFAELDDSESAGIGLVYDYFEVVDGVPSTEASEPRNVGRYKVFISEIDNPNYTLVFDSNYVRGSVEVIVQKLNVKIDVLPAYRIYSVTGSLTPIMRGEIHEEDGWHYYTKEEAEQIYGDDFYKPYKYAEDSQDQFVQNEEDLKATMYIDEYYKELGVKRGVVKLVFDGLVPDPDFLDEDGNWITQEVVGSDGEIIQIIMPRYRNYNIEMNFGDLHVLGGDLSDVARYVSLHSYEQVYNGQDRYDDFRVVTSNENIAKALKFSVFQYVAISSLSKTEADALAKAHGKYAQLEENGEIKYERDDEAGTYVRKFYRRVENGDSVSDKIVNAGKYFVHIEPADADANIFSGVSDEISFTITKAERQVTADDLKVSVNYNQITISSHIEGMEVSFNGAGYVNRNTFVDLHADTSYVVKVRFAETANYLQSQEITLNLHTGIDISAIQSTLAKFDKIDFSNIQEYESKVLAFINSVSQEDMLLIDQAKFAKLQASYEQLLRGANSVIAGAQKAGATAVGKAGKTNTAAKTVALSMSGAGALFAAGMMLFAKKKKEDEQEAQRSNKAKSVGVKRAGKVFVIAVAVVLVCLTVFAGCTPGEDNGEFSREDLYRIASYQEDGQSTNRDLTIEVKSGGMSLYKYENGRETVDDRLDVSNIAFGADGIGFEFDDLYFANAQFDIQEDTATFNADIKETLVFLGVNNAVNGKVSVAVDTQKKSLNTLDVSYDVVSAGITYNVTISVKVK